MKTDQKLEATVRPRANGRTKRYHKPIIVLALVVLALAIAGCGRQIPPYWPDLAADGDVVYVAEMNGQVFALQADTGDVMWSYPVIEQGKGGLLGGCSGPTTSDGPFFAAPAIGDEHIFLGSAGEQRRSIWGKGENLSGLRVLNKSGIPQWEYRGATDRTVAPPTLAGNTVYLSSSDHSVYAIDLNTRDARWIFETGNWVWATPLVVENMVYIASMDHTLYAVNDENGSEAWRFEEPNSALPAAPAYAEGVLYFGSLDGHVYAVQAESGELVWKHKVDGGVWATPIINAGALHFGTLGGKIYALNATDGAELWVASVGGEVRGTPAYANGMVYFGCEDGQLYAFDAQDGSQGVSPLGRQLEKASIYTSPVYDGQHLYVVATDGQVFALDLERNAIVWQTTPNTKEEEK